jgi:hypothetical protein
MSALVLVTFGPAAASQQRIFREFTFPTIAAHATAHRLLRKRSYATEASDIGSQGDVTADPLVARPAETPCVDMLFSGAQFAAYAGQTFPYAPPAGCPGPFAKIVFNGDFAVSAGVQFDRTASIQIGTVPIFFGTTAEPNSLYGPTWHVERDVTDYAALLAAPQTTEADIFNIVNSTYTGVISGSAYLQFYPATSAYPATVTPDAVLPIPGTAGGPQALNTGSSTLSATYTLPTNVVRAYLDVYSQGQQNDEFYYTCAPSNVATELDACGNGSLRETEVSIDGMPAGAAPVTPWIFTGGIDPYLWTPIPGAQTLEFTPFRVDLTPFAGVLSNGKPHTIAFSVDNADQYFSGIAALLVYRDPGAKTVTGAVTANSLVPNPPAALSESLSGTSPDIEGTIGIASARNYEIDGYVNTSKGLVRSSVVSQLNFSNEQTYSAETEVSGIDKIVQSTTDQQTSQSTGPGNLSTTTSSYVSYPITLTIVGAEAAQVTTIDQHFTSEYAYAAPSGSYSSYASNEVEPTDTYTIANGAVTGNSAQMSSQTYEAFDSTGACYNQTLRAAANTLVAVTNGTCSNATALSAARAIRRALLHRR